MTEPVPVASIGLGWWGGVLADAAAATGLQLVSCFSPTRERRGEFARARGVEPRESLEATLDDPAVRAVLVATPHSTHADIVVAAAEAGKDVFVEKPLALTVAEARRAIDACVAAGVILQVGHSRRRIHAFRRLAKAIDDGELGVVHTADANLSYPKGLTPRTGWRADRAESPAGGMTGLGVHMADNLIRLLGAPQRLSAASKRIVGVGPLDDATTAWIEFADGPLATLTTSMVIPDVARTAVYGTEAAAWVDLDGGLFAWQPVGAKEPQITRFDTRAFDPIADELEEFADCVRDRIPPEVGGPEALPVVAILEAITVSAETGTVVDIETLLNGAGR